MRTSNKITVARVVFAPFFFIVYFLPIWTGFGAAASAYVMIPFLAIAEFTDFLDGYFARKNNEVSDFGKLFDPFADVVLHLTTFTCCMFSIVPLNSYLPPYFFILIVYREFSMTFLRMIAVKRGVAIAARKGGKFKTVMYVAAGFFALFLESCARVSLALPYAATLKQISFVLFGVCVVFSYISFIDYLIHFGSVLKD